MSAQSFRFSSKKNTFLQKIFYYILSKGSRMSCPRLSSVILRSTRPDRSDQQREEALLKYPGKSGACPSPMELRPYTSLTRQNEAIHSTQPSPPCRKCKQKTFIYGIRMSFWWGSNKVLVETEALLYTDPWNPRPNAHLWNWQSRFLLKPSQMLTNPSEPPVANVLKLPWNAIELTGKIFSSPSSLIRWHLNAYFFFCTSGLGSMYSTATRATTETPLV